MDKTEPIREMLRRRIAELTEELQRCKKALKGLEGGTRGITDLGDTTMLDSSPNLPTVSKLIRSIVKVLLKKRQQGIPGLSMESLYEELVKYGYTFAGKDEQANLRNINMAIYRNNGRDVWRDDDRLVRLSERWAPSLQ